MIYELHTTVAPDSDIDKWMYVCNQLRAKPLDIRLSKGEHKRQIMFALVYDAPDDKGGMPFYEWRKLVEDVVRSEGFEIIRSKVEIPLDYSHGIPTDYYEAHIKLMLHPSYTYEFVTRYEDKYAISWNKLNPPDTELVKHFVTDRMYAGMIGYEITEAANRFARAYRDIANMYAPVRMQMEAVIYDSNWKLDEGWA